MSRFMAFFYGLVSYIIFFFVTFLYAIGFVTELVVPKTIDSGAAEPIARTTIVDLLLMSVFAIRHSVVARQGFKRWWTTFIPKPVERSTYVLMASLALALLFGQWRPISTVVWHIENLQAATAVLGLSLVGWLTVLTSTFLRNHFHANETTPS